LFKLFVVLCVVAAFPVIFLLFFWHSLFLGFEAHSLFYLFVNDGTCNFLFWIMLLIGMTKKLSSHTRTPFVHTYIIIFIFYVINKQKKQRLSLSLPSMLRFSKKAHHTPQQQRSDE